MCYSTSTHTLSMAPVSIPDCASRACFPEPAVPVLSADLSGCCRLRACEYCRIREGSWRDYAQFPARPCAGCASICGARRCYYAARRDELHVHICEIFRSGSTFTLTAACFCMMNDTAIFSGRAQSAALAPLAYTLPTSPPASHVINSICRGVCHCSPVLCAGLYLVGLTMCLTSRHCRGNCALIGSPATYLSSMALRYLEQTSDIVGCSTALFQSTVVSSLWGGNRKLHGLRSLFASCECIGHLP